jgi:hypothetical protein
MNIVDHARCSRSAENDHKIRKDNQACRVHSASIFCGRLLHIPDLPLKLDVILKQVDQLDEDAER